MKKLFTTALFAVLSLAVLATASETKSAAEQPFRLGAHVGLGFNTFWNVPAEFDDKTLYEVNPVSEFAGFNIAIGGVFQYRFNDMVSLSPELNFTMRMFYQTLATVERGRFTTSYDYDYNMYIYTVDVPVLVRVNPLPFLFAEVGAQFGFSIYSDMTLSVVNNDTGNTVAEKSLGDWDSESTFWSLVAGVGGTINTPKGGLDVSLRLILDLTPVKETTVETDLQEGVFVKNDSKAWALQLNLGYWL